MSANSSELESIKNNLIMLAYKNEMLKIIDILSKENSLNLIEIRDKKKYSRKFMLNAF